MDSFIALPSAMVNLTAPLLSYLPKHQPVDAAEIAQTLIPSKLAYFPFYHTDADSLLPFISDLHLSLAAPIIAYWAYSMFFYWMDISGLFEKQRIHEPQEISSRNKVTPGEVVKMVLFQHAMQTAIGLVILADDSVGSTDHRQAQVTYAYWLVRLSQLLLGKRLSNSVLLPYGQQAVTFLYWWGVPIAQMLWASCVMDTWQYFMHRYFHTNKYLYRQFHSWHHRLYVPYAFGALYNHPFEGILFDTGGAGVSHYAALLSTRQDIFLFTFSQLKTVDDHCGFNLKWDPFQFLFGNNADYHDIHHQQFGIKKNFSQPYFTHWDKILNTRMTREQAPRRKHTDQRDPLVKTGEAVPSLPNLKKDL